VLSTLVAAATTDTSDPFASIKDFFKSSTWHFAVRLFWLFLIVLWLSCAYWVYKDAKRRIDDRIVIIIAVLTGLIFGPIGVLIYSILRPPEYLEDVRERELEIRTMEQRLTEEARCPYCKTLVRDDFLVCPHCGHRLRDVCPHCRRPVEPTWRVCPYCEEPLLAAPTGLEVR